MKKIFTITSSIFLSLPLITLAECKQEAGKLTYCALEPKAFGDVAVNTTSLGAFLAQAFQYELSSPCFCSRFFSVLRQFCLFNNENIPIRGFGMA
jgi:hypothetical protein